MEIRQDFDSVKEEISRLLLYAKELSKNDRSWAHYKNKEDFDKIHISDLGSSEKADIETLYSAGRDMAGYTSDTLNSFNHNISENPSLTSCVNAFSNESWVYDDSLEKIAEKAKKANESLNLWSVNEMYKLYYNQLEILKNIRKTISDLKQSNLYKKENGIKIMTKEDRSNETTITASKIAAFAVVVAAIIGAVAMFLTQKPEQNINIQSDNGSTVITGDKNKVEK